jgi:TPP-dependent pyruvate/acetoin dehydrogenase alpha subunit
MKGGKLKTLNHEAILKMGRYQGLSLEGANEDLVRRLHRFMLTLRRCQEDIAKAYHPADEMRCPVHFCIGEEAAPAALSTLIRQEDYLFSHHRSHGYFLAKGGTLKALVAELHGKATGADGGVAGSQEISMPSCNFFSGAIISGTLATATGAGLGLKMKGRTSISVAAFGDAATEQGVFWEAISLAVLKKLPVLFLCENNRYSTYSPQWKRQAADNIHERVAAFGLPSVPVFGNDVMALHRLLGDAIDSVRAGVGPFFVETYTYRQRGHVGPEDDDYIGYRPPSELEFWQANCPILLLEEQMASKGILTPDGRASLLREVDAEIADAFRFAKDSPFPTVHDWAALNYCQETPEADRLPDEPLGGEEFDQHQKDTRPEPY